VTTNSMVADQLLGCPRPAGVNQFTLKVATVNGTGSASANSLLTRAIFRMGVPVSGKNLVPSNIQGMATWYEIRVDADSRSARTGRCHLLAAMNLLTLPQDTAGVEPGGVVVYDSTVSLPTSAGRDDLHFLGLPLTRLVLDEFDDHGDRTLLRNIAYVGALGALLAIDPKVVQELLEERFAGDQALLERNARAFSVGYRAAQNDFDCPLDFHVEPMAATADAILIDGNTATGIGCLYAGATVAAWYPITPATSVMDTFAKLCARYRRVRDTAEEPDPSVNPRGLDCPRGYKNNYLVIQAEDELAALGMVIGANWNGARAFTSTSGPGISLMGELLGLAYYAEIPVVVFDVQRAGPSTGLPTRTQQADLVSCAYSSHGDTKHLLLFPANPHECFDMAVSAFDYAERFQTPVLVLSDFDIGMNDWTVPRLVWDDTYVPDRGRVLGPEDLAKMDKFFRYANADADSVTARTLPGVDPKGAYFTRGSGHDLLGGYTEVPERYEEVVDRLALKHASATRYLPAPVVEHRDGANVGVLMLGSTDSVVREAVDLLAQEGTLVDTMRIRSFPFHPEVREFVDQHDRCVVVDQNRDGQLRELLAAEIGVSVGSVRSYGGLPPTVPEIAAGILSELGS
jgi:2-oxoglutarate/2-oxoacid ferredoxin oxidoreductase subunit alpha